MNQHKESTKVCSCGNSELVEMSTINLKYCPDCNKWIDWYLDSGQPRKYPVGRLGDKGVIEG